MKKETTKNGVYKSPYATYFVKDNKVMMCLKGTYYQTTTSFLMGNYVKPLTDSQLEGFENTFNKCPKW